jgi:hypothetical protein
MAVDIGDIFLESARTLRSVEFNFYQYLSGGDVEATGKAKK